MTETWPCVPGARVPRFQLTTPAFREPPPVAETKLVPSGSGSERVTPLTAPGPALAYERVYVSVPPASTGLGEAVRPRLRLVGRATTLVMTGALVPGGSPLAGMVA